MDVSQGTDRGQQRMDVSQDTDREGAINNSSKTVFNARKTVSNEHKIKTEFQRDLKGKSDTSTPHASKIIYKIENTTSDKIDIERTVRCYDNAPDGGWGWVVTFSAFMVGFILDGIAFSFGIFFKELLNYYGESKSLTSWIASVFNGTYLGLGPVTSILVSIFGYKRVSLFGAVLASVSFFMCTWSSNIQGMIVLYGLLGGAGLGLLYLPTLVMVGEYFTKKRALATGIAVCGSGVGGFVFAPLSELLIELYTWKGAMWVIAAICLNGLPIAALLRPLKGSAKTVLNRLKKSIKDRGLEQRKENKEKAKGNNERISDEDDQKSCCDINSMFDFELLKSQTFIVYGCSCFLCMLGFFIPFTFIPDLADDMGMTSKQGALLISIIGITNTTGRVAVGFIADRTWANAVYINSIALLVGGAATMFVPYYDTFGIMSAYSVIFGTAIAVFVSLRSVIMAEIFGIEKLRTSFGLVTMCQGVSAFIGAPIAGALSDMTGDYKAAFFMAGAAIALSGALSFPLRQIYRCETRRKIEDVEM